MIIFLTVNKPWQKSNDIVVNIKSFKGLEYMAEQIFRNNSYKKIIKTIRD